MRLFLGWCKLNQAHHLPASVPDVVRFVTDNSNISPDLMHAELTAIDEEHEALLYAPPGKARAVIKAVNAAWPIDAPRSWPAEDKGRFAELPHHLQVYLERREKQRDQAVRDAQNEAAELRKKLKKFEEANAETKTAA
ncbi:MULTISPECIES: hypothetical protein [unclassified Bradyrhizobium]|uniref:hypothetical protein n=1 Tax=unclassified Bradyrhizobium TaxID=2631580 RepID=UPI002478D907|nr:MULTISPECIES: hypothetical protein [unclassified Bradyrhizobium]WGR67841.1 hypothetical protein MTX24_20445 [Bradyrhizobium sp. ISRA426]WGR79894.1 hypothetical protein MTX21_05560 [Bradyrhizobium sp. ISRA430]WGR83080.1 hypothetical protein MTX25_20125 [Bradyrhizobium sp. ISRA432]